MLIRARLHSGSAALHCQQGSGLSAAGHAAVER